MLCRDHGSVMAVAVFVASIHLIFLCRLLGWVGLRD